MHIYSFGIIHLLSLWHSDATSLIPDIHNERRAGYAYDCSGSESRLADCRSHLTENCNTRIGVQCYNITTADMAIIPTALSATVGRSTITTTANLSIIVSLSTVYYAPTA